MDHSRRNRDLSTPSVERLGGIQGAKVEDQASTFLNVAAHSNSTGWDDHDPEQPQVATAAARTLPAACSGGPTLCADTDTL